MASQGASQGGGTSNASLAGITGARSATASDHFPAHLFAMPQVAFPAQGPAPVAMIRTGLRSGTPAPVPMVAKEKYAPMAAKESFRRSKDIPQIAAIPTTQHHYQGAGRFNN